MSDRSLEWLGHFICGFIVTRKNPHGWWSVLIKADGCLKKTLKKNQKKNLTRDTVLLYESTPLYTFSPFDRHFSKQRYNTPHSPNTTEIKYF